MSLKKLRQFLVFDWEGFAKDKLFAATGCVPWLDFDTKEKLGVKVTAVAVRDNTHYQQNEGENVSNLYQEFVFKVGREISIPSNAYITPIGVKATVYGNYMNQLSIKCEDIKIMEQKKG